MGENSGLWAMGGNENLVKLPVSPVLRSFVPKRWSRIPGGGCRQRWW
jgi:hypothetical protein